MTVSLEKTTRPLIRFDDADVDRSTARRYASDLQSRVNKAETNEVLQRVADGLRVDAYDLAEALLDAQRHVATRFGQSMQRRREGEKVAHLGYIAHSVLKSHADGLPTMEPGARSPRIAELTLEVEHAGVVNQSLTQDLTTAREGLRFAEQSFAEERANLIAERDEANERALGYDSRITDVVSDLTIAQAKAEDAAKDRDVYQAAVAYILESLDAEAKARVLGYLDGVRDGLKD